MVRALVFSLIALFSSGCSTLSYLLQAGKGQLEMVNRARPIDEVIQDSRTPPQVAKALAEISKIKKYGESMGLKATSNYVDYVDLKRPYAVWVVSASPKLKFETRHWWFPIVGSVPYMGWFTLEGAQKFAETLKAQDLDVDIRGASAYSTLGWFRDPILSTMLSRHSGAIGDLVDVVLHESVHASFYIKGQSTFNENIASFIAEKLTVKYLHGDELNEYVEGQQYAEKISKSFHAAYEKLSAIYDSSASTEEKLAHKAEIMQSLQKEFQIKREINNATLLQYRTYDAGALELEKLYQACGGDFERFWKKIQTIKKESFKKDQEEELISVLFPLISSGC